MISPQDKLPDAPGSRHERLDSTRCVDIHCHCLPGLDDGPATMTDALELCRALVADGIDTVIATPHQLGRYDGCNSPRAVREVVSALNSALLAEGVPLAVTAGADVRVDERIPGMLSEDLVLTLADGGLYLLLELPHETFIDPAPLLAALAARGVRTVISHPERHETLARRPDLVFPWLAEGALLQLTAGSLLGDFGPAAEAAAWHWLSRRAASLVATDAHNMQGRRPRMSGAIEVITQRLGYAAARRVCFENPIGVLTAQDVAPAARLVGQRGRK